MSNPLRSLMPDIYRHEGVWEGTYRHINSDGHVVDYHKSRVECIFPVEGEIVYIQKNKFTWEDGRTYHNEFGGILRSDKIYWDTETFSGFGWIVKPDSFILDLDRKDDIGARFCEIIVIGEDNKSRARTWHWFKNGHCFKRTLCDERKIG